MQHELMHAAPVTKAHLGFCRVHVHIHPLRRQFQEQDIGRVAFVMQHIAVGLAHGVAKQLVAHKTAVDEQILRIAPGTGVGGQAGQSIKAQRPGDFVQSAGGSFKFLAENVQRPRLPVARRQPPADAAVVDQGEGAFRMRQGDTAQRLVAMGVLGSRAFQEFASRRGVEKQVAHFHHRAARQGGGFRGIQLAVEGAGLPGMGFLAGPAGQGESGNRSDAGQGFTTKAQTGDPFQVIEAGDLAGGVPRQRQLQIIRRDAVAVVGQTDQLDTALLQIQANLAAAGIETVFQQFLDDGGRALDHLAGGDLGNEQVWEEVDMGHGVSVAPASLLAGPPRGGLSARMPARCRRYIFFSSSSHLASSTSKASSISTLRALSVVARAWSA